MLVCVFAWHQQLSKGKPRTQPIQKWTLRFRPWAKNLSMEGSGLRIMYYLIIAIF